MAVSDVTGTPLVVNFVYYSQFADGAQVTTNIETFESLDPALAAQIAPLQPSIGTTMGQALDAVWRRILPQVSTFAVNTVSELSDKAGHNATNIVPSFPTSGTVTAYAYAGDPATSTSPEAVGMLYLYYQLTQCVITFDTGSITAEWALTFNAEVALSSQVPVLPFALAPTTDLILSNANLQSKNAVAALEQGVLEFVGNTTFASVSTEADGSYEVPRLADINNLLTAFNAAGAQLITYGFTQCGFTIANPGTESPALTCTVTHPQDPGPVLIDADSNRGRLTNAPVLAPSHNQATPGMTRPGKPSRRRLEISACVVRFVPCSSADLRLL